MQQLVGTCEVDFLKNINVVAFSNMLMSSSTDMFVGDLGANIMKAEPAGRGATRHLPGSGETAKARRCSILRYSPVLTCTA